MEKFSINSLMAFGLLLVMGTLGGQLAHRTHFFPRITGYIIIGFFLGPHASGILNEALLDQTKIFTELAAGLVLFQLGLQVKLPSLWQQQKIFWMGICECMLSFALIGSALLLLGIQPIQAGIAAAIGVSSSPAAILLISKEYNITGPIIKSALTLTAINNVLAFCLYIMVLPFLHRAAFPGANHAMDALLHPLYRITGSLALAFLANYLLIYMGRFIGKQTNVQFSLIIGSLCLCAGLAKVLNISILFTLLMLGVFLANFDQKEELMEVEFGYLSEIFFVLLFVMTGTHLQLKLLWDVGLMAVVFIVVRFMAKMLAILLFSRTCGYTQKQSCALGLTLIPMASMAFGLISTTQYLSRDLTHSISAMLFASIAMLETFGPVVTTLALKMVGEMSSDAKISH